jgi:hypothetical protein
MKAQKICIILEKMGKNSWSYQSEKVLSPFVSEERKREPDKRATTVRSRSGEVLI